MSSTFIISMSVPSALPVLLVAWCFSDMFLSIHNTSAAKGKNHKRCAFELSCTKNEIKNESLSIYSPSAAKEKKHNRCAFEPSCASTAQVQLYLSWCTAQVHLFFSWSTATGLIVLRDFSTARARAPFLLFIKTFLQQILTCKEQKTFGSSLVRTIGENCHEYLQQKREEKASLLSLARNTVNKSYTCASRARACMTSNISCKV